MPEHPALSSDIEQNLPAGYHVVKLIGKGNFGIVYKAKGPGGKEWAFKITDMSRGKAVGIKEFRAFQNIRRIKPHRNLIEYYGVWVVRSNGEILENAHELSDDDLKKLDVSELIIQMPLAEESLEKRLKKAKRDFHKPGRVRQPGEFPGIPVRELLVYMQGVAEALDHLHSPIHPLKKEDGDEDDDHQEGAGWMLHRDVKPGNILIDRTGNVLVADYGVARAVGGSVTGTQGGAGTPIYSAPEQLSDHVPDPHPSSDQYSLAITYYELRTGSLPIPDESMSSVEDVKLAQILGRLDFSLLPRNEVNVLKRATHKVMAQRYPTCCDFVADLWKANGVLPGRVSGIMPGPVPRAPYSDPDSSLPATLTPVRDSLTPSEPGTLPNVPPSLRVPEPAATVENKPSGTVRVEDLVRATPFKPPVASTPVSPIQSPAPPPAAPPAPPPGHEEELPIAAEAAPWETAPKAKGKSNADFAVVPPEAKATPAPNRTPGATTKKTKSSKEIELPGTGTAYYGADTTAKPASNLVVDSDEIEDSKPPTWIPTGQKKKKGMGPLVWLGGGIGIAAAIAVAVVALRGKDKPEVVVTPSPPPPPPPEWEPSFLSDAFQYVRVPGQTGGVVPPKIDGMNPVTNAGDAKRKLDKARESLKLVEDGSDEDKNKNIGVALKLLNGITVDTNVSDPALKTTATTLHSQWSMLEKVLPAKTPESLARADAFASWTPPDGLVDEDREALVAVYSRLKATHPTAAVRLQEIRAYLRGDSIASSLGAPLGVFTIAGRSSLSEFEKLDDLMPAGGPLSNSAKALAKAWDSALSWDRDTLALREIELKEFAKARGSLRAIDDATELLAQDKECLKEFHRIRLATLVRQFALKPVGIRSATDWSELPERLPKAEDLPGSPWRECLVAESEFLANVLKPTWVRRSVTPPKLAPVGDRYEKLVSAEVQWSRAADLTEQRAAARAILIAVNEAGDLLDSGSRKQALGAVLAQSGVDLKRTKPGAIDAGYAVTDADTELARESLLEAKKLLDGVPDAPASLKDQVGRNLLLASAFPKVVPEAAKKAGVTRKTITDSAESADKASLWLAFARTRDRATDAGLDDALHAYVQLRDVVEARASMMKDLLDEGFQSNLKARDKADEAVGKLYLPLVNSLVERRKKKVNADETKLLRDLLAASARLAPADDGVAIQQAFIGLEDDGKLPASLDATKLHVRVKSDRSLLLQELVKVRSAREEKDPAEKLKRIEAAAEEFKNALDKLRRDESPKLVELLDRESIEGFLELAGLQTNDGRYTDALDSYRNVKTIAGSNPMFDKQVNRMMLGRAKTLWFSASDRETLKKTTAKSELENVIRRNEDTAPEARYWRAVYALYVGEAIGCNSRKLNYENDKTDLLGPQSGSKSSAWTVDEEALRVPAELNGPYKVELLEWRACFACAKAQAAKDAASRETLGKEALKELAELSKSDPLAGAVRRLQFQVNRLEEAAKDGRDGELDDLLKELTSSPVAIAVKALKEHVPSPRIEHALTREQHLAIGFAALARAHAMPISQRKKSPSKSGVLSLVRAIKDLQSTDPKVIEALDELALRVAIDAVKYQQEKNLPEAQACAEIAVHAFTAVGELDPKLSAVAAYQKGLLVHAGTYRSFVATLTEQAIKTDPEQLAQDPDALDLLIRIEGLYEQAESLLERAAADPAAKGRLESARKNRAKLKTAWFDKGLEGAISAAEKANETARAAALKKFQARINNKP